MDGDDRAETFLKDFLRDNFFRRIFHQQQVVIGVGKIIVSDFKIWDYHIKCRNFKLRIISYVFLFYSIYVGQRPWFASFDGESDLYKILRLG